MAVPLQISSVQDPAEMERTTTENVCSTGARVLSQSARERGEQLLIRSLVDGLRTIARVIYCQRLPDGRFGIGLHFQGSALAWPNNPQTGAAD
jgi:hypothetical protein